MNYPEPKSGRRKALVGNILKLVFAGGLFFWLIKSGSIRLEYLAVDTSDIPVLGLACLIIAAGMSLTAFRYKALLHGAGLNLSLPGCLKASALMYFFTQVVLGSASGDVARYFYTVKYTGQGSNVGAAIVIDRIVGMMGLFLLAGVGMVLNWNLVEHSAELRVVAVPLLAILCGLWLCLFFGLLSLIKGRKAAFFSALPFPLMTLLLGFCSKSGSLAEGVAPVLFYSSLLSLSAPLVAPEFLESGVVSRKIFKKSKLGEKIGDVVSAILIYRNSPVTLLKIMLLIAAQHVSFIFAIYLLSQIQRLPVAPGLNEVFFAAPLAFLAGVIPAPAAGLGVNEVAFETLLVLVSNGTVTAGASIFLMNRFWVTILSLSGLPVLLRGRKVGEGADVGTR